MKLKNTLTLLLIFYSISGNCQDEWPSFSDVVRDTQKWDKQEKNMKMVWWIPTKYWEFATKDDPNVTHDAIKQIMNAVDKYTLVAALNVNITPFGSFDKDSVSIKLIDSEQEIYQKIPIDEISSDTKAILNILKPVLANAIGKLGESIDFFVFPRNNKSNNKIASPTNEEDFTVLVNDTKFIWDLPLSTFIPRLACSEDNVLMNGKWKYCPWHGIKLKTIPSEE